MSPNDGWATVVNEKSGDINEIKCEFTEMPSSISSRTLRIEVSINDQSCANVLITQGEPCPTYIINHDGEQGGGGVQTFTIQKEEND